MRLQISNIHTGETISAVILLTNNHEMVGEYSSVEYPQIYQMDNDVNFVIYRTGLTLNFVNTSKLSTGTWLWDFGDGTTSTEKEPNGRTYLKPSVVKVSLTYSGSDIIKSVSKTIDLTSINTLVNEIVIDDSVEIVVTGKTESYLKTFYSYRTGTQPNIGTTRDNFTITDVNNNVYTYVDDPNGVRPITYNDNGVDNVFEFKAIGFSNEGAKDMSVFVPEYLIGFVEKPKITINIDINRNGISVLKPLLTLGEKNNLGEIANTALFNVNKI